jgi:predicted ATPase
LAQQIPAASTSFVGREDELAALERLLHEGARVVTLKGPGGAGKTRLALAFAERARADPELDGVLFAGLAAASDVEQACEAIASAFELSFGGRGTLALQVERATSQLGRCLIVIDNVDTLAESLAPLVASWSRAAPDTLWIVTSREPLRIPEEHVMEVPPLVGDAALRLFVDRANRRRVGFEPSAEERNAIADIVQKLDGLPLAIELCAARVGVLGVRQLQEQLASGLEVAIGKIRGAPARHSTLRAAVEGSWNALSLEERGGLVELAVFAGSFDSEAAAHVLSKSTSATLAVLEGLVEKSLLMTFAPSERPGTLRFTVLGSIREYAREQLADRTRVEARLAEYFAHAERWQSVPHPRLELEVENLYAALEFLRTRRDDRALAVLRLLEPIQTSQGISPRFVQALDALVDAMPSAPAHELRGFVLASRGELEAAQKDAERSSSSLLLATIASARGDHASAEAAFARVESPTPLYHELYAEHALRAGRIDDAVANARTAREVYQRLEDTRGEGCALVTLGMGQAEQGRVDEAKESFADALALGREVRDVSLIALASCGRALLEADQGPFAELEQIWKLHGDALRPALEAVVLRTLALGNGASGAAFLARTRGLEPLVDRRYDTAFFQRLSVTSPSESVSASDELEVAKDGNWFRFGGARCDLGRRGPLRRVLQRLVGHHAEGGTRGLTVYELFEAGWPGEQVSHDAALARVYVTVRRLRKLGLDGVLATRDSGYLLDPNVVLRVSS